MSDEKKTQDENKTENKGDTFNYGSKTSDSATLKKLERAQKNAKKDLKDTKKHNRGENIKTISNMSLGEMAAGSGAIVGLSEKTAKSLTADVIEAKNNAKMMLFSSDADIAKAYTQSAHPNQSAAKSEAESLVSKSYRFQETLDSQRLAVKTKKQTLKEYGEQIDDEDDIDGMSV